MSPEDRDTLELLEVLSTGEVPLPADLRQALQDTGLIERRFSSLKVPDMLSR